jgi:hypothetical protein
MLTIGCHTFQEWTPMANRAIIDRFWSHTVASGDCIIWVSGKFAKGYGAFTFTENGHKRQVRASRMAYELFVGPISPGMIVRHTCDNPSCVNPKHLVIGTHQDNMNDMKARNRSAKRERNGNSKLSSELVKKIRDDYRSQDAISKEYGVAQSTISRIKRGKMWK